MLITLTVLYHSCSEQKRKHKQKHEFPSHQGSSSLCVAYVCHFFKRQPYSWVWKGHGLQPLAKIQLKLYVSRQLCKTNCQWSCLGGGIWWSQGRYSGKPSRMYRGDVRRSSIRLQDGCVGQSGITMVNSFSLMTFKKMGFLGVVTMGPWIWLYDQMFNA